MWREKRTGYWHAVPGGRNTWRVIALVCVATFEASLTWYAKVPALPLVKVNVAVPTVVRATRFGLNGTALNAGPVVRNSVPEYVFGPVCAAVTEYHSGLRFTS